MSDPKMQDLVAKIQALAKRLNKTPSFSEVIASGVMTHWQMRKYGLNTLVKAAGLQVNPSRYEKSEEKAPKILILDIETSTMTAKIFDPRTEYVRSEQVVEDWSVLCWAAKWLGEDEIIQGSVRGQRDLKNDRKMLEKVWKLLDEADVVVTHNGVKFDIPKLRARFAIHDLPPLTSWQNADTYRLAWRVFGFTYKSLAYLSRKINKVHFKEDHPEFPGLSLWIECENKNDDAWEVMERYNRKDILVLEELYLRIRKHDDSVNYSNLTSDPVETCACGSVDWKFVGYHHTKTCRYDQWRCLICQTVKTGRKNVHTKEKMEGLRK